MSASKPGYDAVIVGARCAGAATALLLARAGQRVLVVDRQGYGSDTVSTHALMRGAVLQLKRWGVLPAIMAEGTPEVRRTTFHYGEEATVVDIKAEHGVAFLCAPRRHVLDRVLVDAAVAAGAEVYHGVTVAGLVYDRRGRVAGVALKDADGSQATVAAEVVIGADGRQSTVARQVDATAYAVGSGASGYVYAYYEGLADDGVHWYFNDGVAAGAIPTNGGRHCVFVGVPRDRFAETFRGDLEGGLLRIAEANSPALRAALDTARLAERPRGFCGGPGYLKQACGAGWALVGDAAYFKDPLTAHGITDALRDAELLSRAVLDGRAQAFSDYQERRDALSWPLFQVTDDIASFEWDLDRARCLHGKLSEAMKAEARHIAAFSPPNALAA